MKPCLLFLISAAVTSVTAAALIVASIAQAAQGPQETASGPQPQPRVFPVPTNLKVLPKGTTGQQVNDIMQQWERSLGIQCNSCHAEDRENLDPNGRPQLNFADDSKPMKAVARTMYTMTEEINSSYLAKIDSSGVPLTCGTCHRGHLGPEPFIIPPDEASRAPQSPAP